jgi:hypothetical protein
MVNLSKWPGNLPCRGYDQNKVWLELALAAADLLPWTQAPCLDGDLARCEPTALRYRTTPRRRPPDPHQPPMAPQDRQRLALGHPPDHRLRPITRRTLAHLNATPRPLSRKDIGEPARTGRSALPTDRAPLRQDQLPKSVDQLRSRMKDRC